MSIQELSSFKNLSLESVTVQELYLKKVKANLFTLLFEKQLFNFKNKNIIPKPNFVKRVEKLNALQKVLDVFRIISLACFLLSLKKPNYFKTATYVLAMNLFLSYLLRQKREVLKIRAKELDTDCYKSALELLNRQTKEFDSLMIDRDISTLRFIELYESY